MSELKNYIENLTLEEKEQFSDLIEECLSREKWLDEHAGEIQQNFMRMCFEWDNTHNKIEELKESVISLKNDTVDLQVKLYLDSIEKDIEKEYN